MPPTSIGVPKGTRTLVANCCADTLSRSTWTAGSPVWPGSRDCNETDFPASSGRVTLLRDKVESFDVYPFSLPVVRTLATFFADVSVSVTKNWNADRSFATHFSRKSTSPESMWHSRT